MTKPRSYKRDLLSRFIRFGIVPLWAAWEKSPYLRHYRHLKKSQFAPAEETRAKQLTRLKQIVEHAYETTSFYRQKFDAIQLNPRQLMSPDELTHFPILTKKDLQNEQSALVSSVYADKLASVHTKKTSGSTGVSVQILLDEPALQFKRACTLRSNEWTGWKLGEPRACIWGNPEYLKRGWRGRLRNALLDRQIYLDTVKMDEAAMREFAGALYKHPPSLLFGHAHSLYLFAEYCRASGGAGFRPTGIISTAMVLHDWERKSIEEIFDRPVTNRYGCEELSLVACECEQHNGLHINSDGIFVEVIRADGRNCEPGEVGALVITDLVNRAMPLIRYRVGDMGAVSDRKCECGRSLPMLERIEGRIADYVVTAQGDLISGISLTENFAMMVPGIAQLQIVQKLPSQFLFRIVRGAQWGAESERKIRDLVIERFGRQTKYTFDFVETIPQESSGKYRFCISEVPNPFTGAI